MSSSPSEPEEAEGLTDGANDVAVVEQPDGTLRATEFHVQASWESRASSRFGSHSSPFPRLASSAASKASLRRARAARSRSW